MKVAIIQFPGSNCEVETGEAAKAAGLSVEIFRWNRDPEELKRFDGFILPGGFSYQDRIRAGVVAAKKPILSAIKEMAEKGAPVLGICNGAQILVEAGMVPGMKRGVEMALAQNLAERQGFICRWVFVKVESNRTPFLSKFKEGEVFPIPIAHAEGRFVTEDREVLDKIIKNRQIALRYCTEDGRMTELANPNGSVYNIAGITNSRGNILALMPHPERCSWLWQTPSFINGRAEGRKIFEGMKRFKM
jgi:phosphoribosylformylglycinamidine synthase